MTEVRLAAPSEYEQVGLLTVEAYMYDGYLDGDEDYALELADAAARAANAELWVAADGPLLLGTVTYCPPGSPNRELATSPDQAEFRMLAVSPSARRRGVGRMLVQHCITRSRELGQREMVLSSLDRMTSAHTLYAALGFVRAPHLDWEPSRGFKLWGFVLSL